MIPSIANYLNITAGQLFNINLEDRKINIQKILDLDDKYADKFDLKSSLELLEKSLKQYPNDECLLLRLARNYHNQICLMKEDNEEKEIELSRKIVEICLKVLEIAKDDQVRIRANTLLCWNYVKFGEEGIKKAKEIADKMPSIYQSKEELFVAILSGKEKEKHIQSLFVDYLNLVIRQINRRFVDLLNSNEEKIEMLKKAIELTKIIIGDNLYTFNRECSNFAFKIAKLYAEMEDKENTIHYLFESIEHAKNYTLLSSTGVYDSFWLKDQKWEKEVTKGLLISTSAFDDKVFDFIRGTEDFNNIIKILED